MNFQSTANQLHDAFEDTIMVIKSYILAANILAQIEIPKKNMGDLMIHMSLEQAWNVDDFLVLRIKILESKKLNIPKMAENIFEEKNHEAKDDVQCHEPEENH